MSAAATDAPVVGRIEPEVLTAEQAAAACAFPDPALVAWAQSAGARYLSERESHHVRVLAARRLDVRNKAQVAARHSRDEHAAKADAIANAARFVRSILRHGDHHIRRMRLALEAVHAAAAAAPDDGTGALLDEVAARGAVVLDGLRYVVMPLPVGARELRLSSPRHAVSTFRPVPGTATWLHASGTRRSRVHRWYRRLADGQFLAELRSV